MQVDLTLMEFVGKNILPRYNDFDSAHNMSHANSVIRRSLSIASHLGADANMAYAIAAYHDLGLKGPRAIHHLTGGKILRADKRLLKWFSTQQINIMAEAVEDHRASASHAPRSVYGRIVAEADRDLTPETVFTRTIQYGLTHSPEATFEQHWQRFQQHMKEKYSTNGYIHLWIEGSENHKHLANLRQIIANKDLLRKHFEECFFRITNENK